MGIGKPSIWTFDFGDDPTGREINMHIDAGDTGRVDGIIVTMQFPAAQLSASIGKPICDVIDSPITRQAFVRGERVTAARPWTESWTLFEVA